LNQEIKIEIEKTVAEKYPNVPNIDWETFKEWYMK